MAKKRNNKILLSFDIEEFDLPLEFGAPISDDDKYGVSVDGTIAILDLLDRHPEVKATFFVTANFALRAPELVERMAVRHEVASHGCDHSSFHTSDLTESRLTLSKISGQRINGFRMARLAAVAPEDIMAAGYFYDSSKNPTFLPGRYNNLGLPIKPYREECGLLQMPVSVVPFCRFPLFWLSFKNLPFDLYWLLAKLTLRNTGFFSFYTHPWEYSSSSAAAQWRIPGYITRHAGEKQLARLEKLLIRLAGQGEFTTLSDFAAGYKA